ncbi:hypothetical protein H6P81_011435 [Aristolochia fimbriata]|uniref:Uncharacterized protein n=1 Tax=Aristolochia fimbriata TaxID=158543 RepID=A0AAV7ERI2_ARIFI|nr:hypothetical protein H6P81_011435 [Aristolochia fimbriata]
MSRAGPCRLGHKPPRAARDAPATMDGDEPPSNDKRETETERGGKDGRSRLRHGVAGTRNDSDPESPPNAVQVPPRRLVGSRSWF